MELGNRPHGETLKCRIALSKVEANNPAAFNERDAPAAYPVVDGSFGYQIPRGDPGFVSKPPRIGDTNSIECYLLLPRFRADFFCQ